MNSEHALLGVAEFACQMRQADIGVAQIVFGGFAAHAVDDFAEGGVLRTQSSVKRCPGMQIELGGDQLEPAVPVAEADRPFDTD